MFLDSLSIIILLDSEYIAPAKAGWDSSISLILLIKSSVDSPCCKKRFKRSLVVMIFKTSSGFIFAFESL